MTHFSAKIQSQSLKDLSYQAMSDPKEEKHPPGVLRSQTLSVPGTPPRRRPQLQRSVSGVEHYDKDAAECLMPKPSNDFAVPPKSVDQVDDVTSRPHISIKMIGKSTFFCKKKYFIEYL